MLIWRRYINIRRGQVICAIIGGWALCPWEILASAPGFLSFMGGYTVFLGPFVGMYVLVIPNRCTVYSLGLQYDWRLLDCT